MLRLLHMIPYGNSNILFFRIKEKVTSRVFYPVDIIDTELVLTHFQGPVQRLTSESKLLTPKHENKTIWKTQTCTLNTCVCKALKFQVIYLLTFNNSLLFFSLQPGVSSLYTEAKVVFSTLLCFKTSCTVYMENGPYHEATWCDSWQLFWPCFIQFPFTCPSANTLGRRVWFWGL